MDRSSLTYYMPLPLSLASMNDPGHDFANGDEESARFEIPNPSTKYALLVDKINNATPTKPSIVGFEFSLYSNLVCFSSLSLSLNRYNRPYYNYLNHQDSAAAPQDTRHPFLTPVRPSPIKEIGFTILRNASDRVTEILRENRRRLDAGEDSNTIRSTLDLNHCFFGLNFTHLFPPTPPCIRGSSSQTRHGTFCCS